MLLCDADNLATIQSYIHKHPHELLDSVVKERFDQAFRLNRGRAFYSSLSHCQAVFSKISFLLNRLPLRSIFISRQREANHTAFKTAVNHLFQPPLSTASDQPDRSHQQDSTTTLSARRILLESAASATLNLKATC